MIRRCLGDKGKEVEHFQQPKCCTSPHHLLASGIPSTSVRVEYAGDLSLATTVINSNIMNARRMENSKLDMAGYRDRAS